MRLGIDFDFGLNLKSVQYWTNHVFAIQTKIKGLNFKCVSNCNFLLCGTRQIWLQILT